MVHGKPTAPSLWFLFILRCSFQVAVMLSNDYLSQVASSQSEATKWVTNNVQPFIFPGGVNIT